MGKAYTRLGASDLKQGSVGGHIRDRAEGAVETISQFLLDGRLLTVRAYDEPLVGAQPQGAAVLEGSDAIWHGGERKSKHGSEPPNHRRVSTRAQIQLRYEGTHADRELTATRLRGGGESVL